VPWLWSDKGHLERLTQGIPNQGVAAQAQSFAYRNLDDYLRSPAPGLRLTVIADEIEDPRNLGAIARCAEGLGAGSLIVPSKRGAPISPAALKASGGALERLPIIQTVNMVQAIEKLKQHDFWLLGMDANQGELPWHLDLKRHLGVVIGSEGRGMRRLVREHCDMVCKIPMAGAIGSFNASVAAGIVLYEIQRQRLNLA
jgi:23S rRNA (guanosine2251-2'-O)-methyltransferase